MLRILHVTDLHYHKPFYDWVMEQSKQYDVVCISGDLIGQEKFQSNLEDKHQQKNEITQWLERMTKPTFVCSGNHDVISDIESELNFNPDDFDSSIDDADTNDWSEEPVLVEKCTWLTNFSNKNIFSDNTIHSIKNIIFGVVPYNYNGSLSKYKNCHVLLHHEPPATTATAIQNTIDWGNTELYQAIKNHIISPNYVLCSHVHQPNKTRSKINKTDIYNPGASFLQNIPKHNILEI